MMRFLLFCIASSNLICSYATNATIFQQEATKVIAANQRLHKAIENPEYILKHWIKLPIAPITNSKTTLHLTLREAILLALRYNPNIQNAELDRILQRYQLRLAQNAFEMQYALAGNAMITKAHYSGVGSGSTHSYFGSPEFNYKNTLGTQAALKMDNNFSNNGNYNPLLNLSIKQPLLKGFGRAANEAGLLNAIDTEWLNKLNLQQSIIDQITTVIIAYRALILTGHHLKLQQHELLDAKNSYATNEKKIAAGQLEPTANIQQSYQIESLNLTLEQSENNFNIATQDLLQAIGLNTNIPIAVPSDIQLVHVPIPNLQRAIQQALKYNTQYLALKVALKADKRAYEAAKNQQLWQLDVAASVQAGTVTNVDSNSVNLRNIYAGNNVTEVASVTLTVPLEDLGSRSSLISAKIKLEQDKIAILAAKRTLTTTIKNTLSTIQSLIKRYELAKRQVSLAEQSYNLEKKKQQAGIASALDVSNTQNQLIQAQLGLIDSKISYLNQVSNLQSLLGTTLSDWNIQLRYTG